MAHSLLQGKRFYCREWAFNKLLHSLENRQAAKTCGALVMGGPGSGKTALSTELVWPTNKDGKQRILHRRLLAYHFCQAHDVRTLSVAEFVLRLVEQLSKSLEIEEYAEKVKDPAIQAVLQPAQVELSPDEAFKRGVLLPLLGINPPTHNCFILVDSVDESYLLETDDKTEGSKTIAELLARHHELFPPWCLLVCSSRKQSKSVNRLFTGFRKVSLDDLRKSHAVRDVQQYILARLDNEEALRVHLNRDTAEMLNQLHIKSNGCFLYLEKVLDGVAENFIMLREIKDIPGTLNGLYLWLCQRLFVKRQFVKIQPILNVMLAARKPLTEMELFDCAWTRNTALTLEEFQRRMDLMSRILLTGRGNTCILFHHSFAEWLLDVKHCTQKYLCNAAEGHGMLAMKYTLFARSLAPVEVQEFAAHLVKSNLVPPLESYHLALWLIWSGAPVKDSLQDGCPLNKRVTNLLLTSGACADGSPQHGKCRTLSNRSREEEDSVREMLENGATINQVDANGRTLLCNAAYHGNLQICEMLIARGADLEVEDKSGQTALNLGARQGHEQIVRTLLRHGANPNHMDHDGWTPLRSAAWGGQGGVVSALLQAGASVDFADTDRRTALRAASWGGHEEVVSKLLEHGADVNKADNEGRTALIAAAYMGHKEIVEHLLNHGAEIDHEDSDGRTALSVAALCVPASQGHADVVELLIDRGANVNHEDKEGMTPLLVAAYENHTDVIELLLENDADVDHSDNNGRTPLLAAASMGHAQVVHQLLFWGAAVDSIDTEGRTVLSIASAQGSVEVVHLLLQRGLDEMHRDNAGWTPLHMAAFEGHREVCELLTEQGARTSEADNDGRQALILAAQEGHIDCIKLLLDHGADIDHMAHDGRNALRVAAIEGHKDIIQMLIEGGSEVNLTDGEGRTTLYILALENKLEMAELLLKHNAYVDSTDLEGRSPLHVASWQGHTDMVQLLLDSAAKVNGMDNERRTALQSAAWQGHAKVVKALLERGADVDHTCNQGATALCIAAQEGHIEVVKALLQYGANPHHADQCGRTPMRVAIKGGHHNIKKLLESVGAPSTNGYKDTGTRRSTSSCATSTSSGSGTRNVSGVATNGAVASSSSPSESPDSTIDRCKSSSISNQSSKSSSNLTSSTVSTIPISESQQGLTFTQEIQSTMSRSRREKPERPTHLPVKSKYSNSLQKDKHIKDTIVEIPLTSFDSHLNNNNSNSPKQTKKLPRNKSQPVINTSPKRPDLTRQTSCPSPLKNFVNGKGNSTPAENKVKRNGIVTNPNCSPYRKSPVPLTDTYVSQRRMSDLEFKQAVKISFEGPTTRNGFKKETPL
ncbi:uncharacterized protein LOC144917458 [Branchiostoma floridae x Branchiostoma belcheri]